MDDKCAGCKRGRGCERVKPSQPATSAPAESPKPRARHAPERFEDAFPAEIRDQRESDNEAVRKKLKPPPVTESPIVAWLTGAAVKQAIAKAARSLAEGKSDDVIAQVGSLVEENALLKSDNAVLRNEIASLAKRLDKVRAELDAIKRAVARGLNKEDFEFSSHRSIIDEIVGKGYGHTESGERLLRMHAQEVVELILKKAGEDVLKQIELAAAVKDRLTDVNPNKDLPVALAIVESVKLVQGDQEQVQGQVPQRYLQPLRRHAAGCQLSRCEAFRCRSLARHVESPLERRPRSFLGLH